MEVGVLGPLELRAGEDRVALGGPKQRLVLGLLVARRGRVVSVDELIDGLWPEGPQASPRKTVQVYVTRLRRALGDDADAIRSAAAGYVFDPALVAVDADAFADDLAAARRATDDEAAAAALRAALGRWRGDAFADLRDSPSIVASAVQLDELRITALHELFDLEIRHRPRAVIAELERTVEAHPLDEGFAAQLMVAQYAAGRQADALATFQALRRRLADELGLEPGPAARELEARILRHELTVAAPPAVLAPERQRRRVSVVAVELDVAAATDHAGHLDPEEELDRVAPVRRAALARMREAGGVVLDDTGTTLTACFGYPAVEAAAERAVVAALAVRDLAGEAQLAARVGVDTGVVVVESPSDHPGRSEVTGIAGAPLRAASRLRDAARPGQVLLGPATAALVDAAVHLSDDVLDGGVRLAVAPVAGDPAPSPARLIGLVGREDELRELRDAAGRARDGWCSVVVTGQAGVGKTALVESFLAGLDEAAWSVLRLRCDPRRAATPLHPFREHLADLFEDGDEPTPHALVQALRAHWAQRRPLLVVEDLHAADPTTVDVLDVLPDRVATGLLVVTTREAAPGGFAHDDVQRVDLGPLDRASARQVVNDVAAVATTSRLRLEVVNEIVDRAGGVPLHLEALTLAVATGDGDVRPGVPTSLYDSLMTILDRLGPARAAVQRCAVLGESFGLGDVALLDADPAGPRIADQLDELVGSGVLVADGPGRYRFAHALIAEAAYESMLQTERAALHARLAEALPPAATRAEPDRLAYHLEAAGRPLEAASAWRRAAAAAIRRAHHREAQQHARRALRLVDQLPAPPPPEAADVRRRALVHLAVGLQAASHGSAELLRVVEEAQRAGVDPSDVATWVMLQMIDVSNRQALGDFAGATSVARECLAVAEAAGDPLWTSFARQFLGASLVWCGELEAGTRALEEAGSHWDDGDDPGMTGARTVGALWSLLGVARHFQGRPRDAAALIERARSVVPDEDGYGRCLVAAMGAVVDQLDDRPDAVREAVTPMWSLAVEVASDFWLGWAQVLLGWAIAAEDPAGLAMMTEALDASTTRQGVPYFAYLLGARLCEHGRVDDGLARLEDGLAVAEATGEALWVPLLHAARARAVDAERTATGP